MNNVSVSKLFILMTVFAILLGNYAIADEATNRYPPAKVVYDVTAGRAATLENILDRASMLQNIYQSHPFDASIVIVVHGSAIPLFAKKTQTKTSAPDMTKLMERARSLSVGEIVQFRVCRASARLQGYAAEDLQDFVTMVPMADAELVMLQTNGYAYIR